MTINQARQQLTELCEQEKDISLRRKQLKKFILNKGGSLDVDKNKKKKRDIAIYMRWISGETFAGIARRYKLSSTTVGNICRRLQLYAIEGKPGFKGLSTKQIDKILIARATGK